MAQASVTVKAIQGVLGKDCPYCAADRFCGHNAECVHFIMPYVIHDGAGYWAALELQDGGPGLRRGPHPTFDEAANEANAACVEWSTKMAVPVRCCVPSLADGGVPGETVKFT
jgi:hypothetical protein